MPPHHRLCRLSTVGIGSKRNEDRHMEHVKPRHRSLTCAFLQFYCTFDGHFSRMMNIEQSMVAEHKFDGLVKFRGEVN